MIPLAFVHLTWFSKDLMSVEVGHRNFTSPYRNAKDETQGPQSLLPFKNFPIYIFFLFPILSRRFSIGKSYLAHGEEKKKKKNKTPLPSIYKLTFD